MFYRLVQAVLLSQPGPEAQQNRGAPVTPWALEDLSLQNKKNPVDFKDFLFKGAAPRVKLAASVGTCGLV